MTNLLIQDAKEELKRADHMLYISLKYTRTCDVMRNIIARLIAAFDLAILAILEMLKETGKIVDIPDNNKTRAEMLSKYKRNSKVFLELYYLLLKLLDCTICPREEYRKHVTMICDLGGKKFEVDVPLLTEYFKKTKQFLEYAEGEVN
jgi:hypothetical protein